MADYYVPGARLVPFLGTALYLSHITRAWIQSEVAFFTHREVEQPGLRFRPPISREAAIAKLRSVLTPCDAATPPKTIMLITGMFSALRSYRTCASHCTRNSTS